MFLVVVTDSYGTEVFRGTADSWKAGRRLAQRMSTQYGGGTLEWDDEVPVVAWCRETDWHASIERVD